MAPIPRHYGATVPSIILHEHFGALKYGLGYNTEQELTDNLRVFGRFGWDDGAHESFAYTEVDQTDRGRRRLPRRPLASTRGQGWSGNRFQRHQERPSELLAGIGGLGFLLGDGNLSYGRENIVEGYYNMHAWRGVYYASMCKMSTTPATTRRVVPPGWGRCGHMWIFDAAVAPSKLRITFWKQAAGPLQAAYR